MEIKYKVFKTEEDWKEFRRKFFTASKLYSLLAEPTKAEKDKGEKLSKGAKTYIEEKIANIIAVPQPGYYNSDMERGKELEPQAALKVAEVYGKSVEDIDFVYTSIGDYLVYYNESLNLSGTPDIIIQGEKVFEIKCPKSATHLRYIRLKNSEDLKKFKPEYYTQLQVNMFLTGIHKGAFVSYDDRFYRKDIQYKELEVNYDEEFIEQVKTKLIHAGDYMNDFINEIENYGK